MKKVARNLNVFEWLPIYFFSHNLFIKSVLAIGTLYSLIFSFFKVVYDIVFGVTPDIKIISFGVSRLKNRRVTPNREEILSKYCMQHCFICRPSDSTVSEDAGIEPKTACVCTTEECTAPVGVCHRAWAASGRVCTTEEWAASGGVYTTGAWAASGRVCMVQNVNLYSYTSVKYLQNSIFFSCFDLTYVINRFYDVFRLVFDVFRSPNLLGFYIFF